MAERCGLVPDSESDGPLPLDATVGSLDHAEAAVPFASAADVPVRISVTGDGVSDATAMGLAQDLSLLIQGLMRSPSAGRKRTRSEALHVSDSDADVQIALHGLQLDPEAEDEVHQLVRELVRDRVPPAETAE
jgi:hypothetical protein